MKKILIFLTFILVFLSFQSASFAEQRAKLAVFKVDEPVYGAGYTIFPDVLSIISGDVVNSLNKEANVNVVDMASAESMLTSAGLYKDYKKFLRDYKSKYIIDYDKLSQFADALGVNQIVFVSGGFDTQEMVLKKGLLNYFSFVPILGFIGEFMPNAKMVDTSYRLNVSAMLIDPQSGIKNWEKTYSKDFSTDCINIPTQYFGADNTAAIKIKSYSSQLSHKIALNIADQLMNTEITDVNSTIIKHESAEQVYKKTTTDGTMTRDGQSSNSDSYLKEQRKKEYVKWVKNTL